jgi:hypothetical protein
MGHVELRCLVGVVQFFQANLHVLSSRNHSMSHFPKAINTTLAFLSLQNFFSLLFFLVSPWHLFLRVWEKRSPLLVLLFVPLAVVFQGDYLTSQILVLLVISASESLSCVC